MRYSLLLVAVLSAACAPAPAPAPPPDTRAADEAAVRQADDAWSKAAEARNLDAVVAFYTADARLMSPNEPLAVGTEPIRKVWASLMSPDLSVSWKIATVEAARSGDLAYVTGSYRIAMKPADDVGKMVEVWKKQDGSWKCVADIFNSDLPPAPAAAPGAK